MSKLMQRKKHGYTKDGEVKIVSLSIPQLVPMLKKTASAKKKAKIQRRLNILGYVAPTLVAEETATEQN